MDSKIPVNSITFTGNENKYLTECIDSGWISHEGPFIEKFENKFSSYVGRKFGVAVSSGSAALDIAILATGISKGDEVIMPAFTIISPALSVVRVGAIPVLVDCDPDTYNMDVNAIESKITSKTKAIIIVHIYGLPVEVDVVLELAKKYKLKVIEDAAEMHGQTYKEKKCGSFGDISIFSFYANKIVSTGEGGMILCDDETIAVHCRKLRNLAFESLGPRFIHKEIGYNYRMTNMQAAIGLAQLEQIDSFISKKRSIGKFYIDNLAFLLDHGYQLPIPRNLNSENIYWVNTIVAPDENEKARIINFLNDNGIGNRDFFMPMHKQPVFTKMGLFAGEQYPNSEKLSRNGFYIPSGLGLTTTELERVVNTIKSFIKIQSVL